VPSLARARSGDERLGGQTVTCRSNASKKVRRSEVATVEVDVLARLHNLADAFLSKDINRILSCFSEDCVFYWPRGPAPRGRRLEGKREVREALLARFEAIPDATYSDYEHFACGDKGVSRWHLAGTTTAGTPVDVWGIDISTFDSDGLVAEKDAYWKVTLEGPDGEYGKIA
jgi:ketosteroid isomerase-like protein